MEGVIGEIRMFAGTFAPKDWAFCQGQLVSIQQHPSLYSVISNYYGGDGRTNLGLPDLRSRVPAGTGQSPGNSHYMLGQMGGYESVVLSQSQLPAHTHTAQSTAASTMNGSLDVKIPVNTNEGEETSPANGYLAPSNNFYSDEKTTGQHLGSPEVTNNLSVATNVHVNIGQAGQSTPVYNVQPYLGMNYIICLEGIYPDRP